MTVTSAPSMAPSVSMSMNATQTMVTASTVARTQKEAMFANVLLDSHWVLIASCVKVGIHHRIGSQFVSLMCQAVYFYNMCIHSFQLYV